MTDEELFDALDGLYAYDTGCVDSGIHDEVLREKVIDHIHSMSEKEFNRSLSRFVRKYQVSEEAVEQGYGIEDVASFLRWLDREMGIYI